jgi:acyl transferase domain-containing protein/acyl-CoA synthetase (AMP-forming)/AMP-acid ligase II/acyl carrier protein
VDCIEAVTLWECLVRRSSEQPDLTAFTFLRDGEASGVAYTFAKLDLAARRLAARLQAEAPAGERVALLYPCGPEFLVAFYASLYAGMVAVPASSVRKRRRAERVLSMLNDCEPRFVLTCGSELDAVRDVALGQKWAAPVIASDDPSELGEADAWRPVKPDAEALAFLQYTSGSTFSPRGVMVTHGNVLHQSRLLCRELGHDADTVSVLWLPHYHDMGLLSGIVQPVCVGHRTVHMTPEEFVQHPVRWLQAFERYGGNWSAAPNFAYDLCVVAVSPEEREGLDLSGWRIALNGAEPVRVETLERFAARFAPCGFDSKAFAPSYGLAEVTLGISSSQPGGHYRVYTADAEALGKDSQYLAATPDSSRTRRLVGCGLPSALLEVHIVEPESRSMLSAGRIGEIWARGGSVAAGYWNKPEASTAIFGAYTSAGDGPFLRTGDLGFLAEDTGELIVTGRIKDVIILHGFNHYPQDIERTAAASHASLRGHAGAAFGILEEGEEKLVVVVEAERYAARSLDVDAVAEAVRLAVLEYHEIVPETIVIAKPGAIPLTSSGKVQRSACRNLFLEGTLDTLALVGASGAMAPREAVLAAPASGAAESIRRLITKLAAEAAGVAVDRVDVHAPFASLGLSSLMGVRLAGQLESELGRRLSPTLLYEHTTIAALAAHLAGESEAHPSSARAGRLTGPVAVVGMACRFPGASNPAAFWELLRTGGDAIREVPADRWDLDDYYEAGEPKPGKVNTKWGGFLDGVDCFDAAFFGISAREADSMDPQQRLLLEVTWEALEHGGIPAASLAGTQTGVFTAMGGTDFWLRCGNESPQPDAYAAMGNSPAVGANRISYLLDLKGPSLVVDTACSASLVALHQACQSLRNGECDFAISGGAGVMLSPLATLCLSQANLMSRGGHCRAFDADADGYVRSEGCGVVVLKRLEDARRDGNTVCGVIRGIAVNHDGRGNGLTAPNPAAQEAVLRAALDNAGVSPQEIGYVEAHGTGTALGDPLEMQALKAVYGAGRSNETPCRVGSAKTNIGHLEAVAGMAGLIKTLLTLEHGEIPPHGLLSNLNPLIDLTGASMEVSREAVAWPHGERKRLAGVSAFGFGGTNAHVVVEEAPEPPHAETDAERPLHVIALSARDEKALRELAERYSAHANGHEDSVGDICHTANTGRQAFEHRLTAVCANRIELRDRLRAFSEGQSDPLVLTGYAREGNAPKTAFLFTGQGAQYAGMGQRLYGTQPLFRAVLDECDAAWRDLTGTALLPVMFDASQGDMLQQTRFAQPALFALEYALAKVWESWGVRPDYVLGHSLGEITAACFAGAFTLEDGLRLVAERARLIQSLPAGGGMVAVFGSVEATEEVRGNSGHIELAAINGPQLHVLTGPTATLAEAARHLGEQGLRTQTLSVSHSFHSRQMDPIRDAFHETASSISMRPLQVPLACNRNGSVLERGTVIEAAYWRDHIRNPVQFHAGMQSLASADCGLYIEIGPTATLIKMGRRCVENTAGNAWLTSLAKGEDDWTTLLSAVGGAFVRGCTVDWRAFDLGQGRKRVQLPTYPFQRNRHWFTRAPTKYQRNFAGVAPEETHDAAVDGYFCGIEWEPTVAPEPSGEVQPGTWLILADRGGVGKALARQLEAAGQRAMVHHATPGHDNGGPGTDPASAASLYTLVGDVARESESCFRGIVHLWSLDASGDGAPTREDTSLTCGSLLYCAQGLLHHAPSGGRPGRLTAVTANAAPGLACEGGVRLAQAGVSGFARTLALEYPDLYGGCVDLDLSSNPEQKASLLAQELLEGGNETWTAYRGTTRYAARVVAQDVPMTEPGAFACRADGSYLITGAFGGLGMETARWTARHGARRLILLGRSELPPRCDWDFEPAESRQGRRIAFVRDLEAQGVSVTVAAMQVEDAEALGAFLETYRANHPDIRGVLHLAGVLQDGGLFQMDARLFGRVFAPKAQGAWNLHHLLRDAPLDFFVLFSSAAALLGSAGQANYAAANAWLDVLAAARRADGLPALSVNWGPWSEVGMAAESELRGARMERRGMIGIQPPEGLAALNRLMGRPDTPASIGIIHADWRRLALATPGVEDAPFFSRLMAGAPEPAFDGQILERIRGTERIEERCAALTTHLRDVVGNVMGRPAEDIPVNASLARMGLDSIMVMDVLRRVNTELQYRFEVRELFEQPGLESMASHMVRMLVETRGTESPEAHRARVLALFPRQFTPCAKKNPRAVFVLSTPRSGSTLLRVMLSAHPELFAPPELHLLYFDDMAQRAKALGEARHLDDGIMLGMMRAGGTDEPETRALFDRWVAEGTPVRDVYAMLQRGAGPRLLVDKTPSYAYDRRFLERAEDMFDEPRYINLVRHPYSVVESCVRMRTPWVLAHFDGNAHAVSEYLWTNVNGIVDDFLRDIPEERQGRLIYEDMVREPEQAMRAVCAMLDLKFNSAMLRPYECGEMVESFSGRGVSSIGDQNFLNHTTIDPSLAERWRSVRLPRRLETETRELAARYGYALPVEDEPSDAASVGLMEEDCL